MYKKLLIILSAVLISGSVYAFTDSLWVVGEGGYPGDLVTVEVWLQYEGGGVGDSMSSFDIILTWDAAVCSAEAYTLGPDFVAAMWADLSRIDNQGVAGPPPGKPKIGFSAMVLPDHQSHNLIPRGTHLVATVDFRIPYTAAPGGSTYVDTLMRAFFPPIYLGYVDKAAIATYRPTYEGGWIVMVAVDDIVPTSIISPPSGVFVDSTYTPSAMITNFGSDSLGPIPVICTIDSWADTVEIVRIDGFESTMVDFADWTVPDTGVYFVTVITQYAGDANPANDTLSMAVRVYLFGDVGPVSIISPPDRFHLGYSYFPSAIIKNFGVDSVGPIPVICNIDSWTDSVEIPAILGTDSTIVEFAVWTAPNPDSYSVAIFTEYPRDTNLANDTIIKTVYAFSGIEEILAKSPLPSVHGLSQSYPNPMNTSISICYQVAKRCPVSLKIFDNTGRLVRILVEAETEPGYYIKKWDGKDSSGQSLPNGIYFYRLETYTGPGTRQFLSTKKIILLR